MTYKSPISNRQELLSTSQVRSCIWNQELVWEKGETYAESLRSWRGGRPHDGEGRRKEPRKQFRSGNGGLGSVTATQRGKKGNGWDRRQGFSRALKWLWSAKGWCTEEVEGHYSCLFWIMCFRRKTKSIVEIKQAKCWIWGKGDMNPTLSIIGQVSIVWRIPSHIM